MSDIPALASELLYQMRDCRSCHGRLTVYVRKTHKNRRPDVTQDYDDQACPECVQLLVKALQSAKTSKALPAPARESAAG